MGSDFIDFDVDFGMVTRIKRHPLQSGEKIDAVGWQSKLNQVVRIFKVFGLQTERSKTKLSECFEQLIDILNRGVYPNIQIFGITRMTVKCDRIAADDEISDVIFV